MENQTIHKKIAKSAMMMTIVSVVSLLFSFVQESVFAFFFGADLITDAYTVATQIPVTLFALISTAIGTVVIPCYSKELYGKGADAAARYVSNLITVICGVTLILVLFGEIFAKYVVLVFAPGMDAQTQILATQIFQVVLPTVLCTELMNINTGILNVHKSFVLPALTSNILNVVFVTSIAILADKQGIYAAVFGMILGSILELLYSVLLRRRIVKYHLIFDVRDQAMIQSFRMALPVFVGISAAEINKVVDRMVSSFLEAGSISMLNYASKLSSAVSSLLITGITTVIYPEFSKCSAKNDEKGMADVFLFSMKLFSIIIIPIIFGGTILSHEVIKIVYGRGAFDQSAVYKTAPLFACYLVCLLFTTFRQTSSRMFYSYGDSKTPMRNSIIGIIINITLNIVLGYCFGAIGLALATTIATAVISFLLLRDVKRKNQYIEYVAIAVLLGKIILSSVVMGAAIFGIRYLLKYTGVYKDTLLLMNVEFLFFAVLAGAVIYFLLLFIMKVPEIKEILKFMKRRK